MMERSNFMTVKQDVFPAGPPPHFATGRREEINTRRCVIEISYERERPAVLISFWCVRPCGSGRGWGWNWFISGRQRPVYVAAAVPSLQRWCSASARELIKTDGATLINVTFSVMQLKTKVTMTFACGDYMVTPNLWRNPVMSRNVKTSTSRGRCSVKTSGLSKQVVNTMLNPPGFDAGLCGDGSSVSCLTAGKMLTWLSCAVPHGCWDKLAVSIVYFFHWILWQKPRDL